MTCSNERLRRIHAAIRDHAKSLSSIGRKSLADVEVIDVDSRKVILLTLETLVERRRVRLHYRDWKGEDLPNQEPAGLDFMTVDVPMPGSFASKEVEVSLPGQERLVECSACEGRQLLPCDLCSGTGLFGGSLCVRCFGRCNKSCPACHGEGKRVEDKSLAVTFEARKRSRGWNRGDLPKKSLASVKVKPTLRLEGNPAVELPPSTQGYRQAHLLEDPDLESAARSMIRKSAPNDGERLVAQRLTIREIPVLEATYRWSSTQAKLWLLGVDKGSKLYAPNPPFDAPAQGLLASARSVVKRFRS